MSASTNNDDDKQFENKVKEKADRLVRTESDQDSLDDIGGQAREVQQRYRHSIDDDESF